MGVQFSIKSREAKDRYIDANIKNVISELVVDIKNYGKELVLRKLLLSLISVQLAQNIGVDHHAATEELYYYMKKKETPTLQYMNLSKISKKTIIVVIHELDISHYLKINIDLTFAFKKRIIASDEKQLLIKNIINSFYFVNLWIIQSYANLYSI